MLDYFCIFSKGGAILWTWQLTALRGSPVEALIRTCLLEERSGEQSFTYKPPVGSSYTLKWTLDNSLGLVFVAVYQNTLKLMYVDKLLARVKELFSKQFSPKKYDYRMFEGQFKRELEKAEQRADMRQRPQQSAQGNLTQRKGGGRSNGSLALAGQESSSEGDEEDGTDGSSPEASYGSIAKLGAANGKPAEGDQVNVVAGSGSSAMVKGASDEDDEGAFDVSKIKGKLAKRPPKGVGNAKKEKAGKDKKANDPKKSKKVPRKWGGSGSEKEDEVLDFSAPVGGQAGGGVQELAADMSKASLVDQEEVISDSEDEDEAAARDAKAGKAGGLLSSFVRSIGKNVMGTAALTQEDIAPALEQLHRKLMERNVAQEIASKLCESVITNLVGQRLESFTRISSAVRKSVEEALTRILTPQRSIDILREVHAAKAKGKPYTIVFVGVNGVGKSTNLSKVAYWLLQNDITVMVAACDTFRSGAVEQLKTHCNRLDIPLFERGYEKDPAKVAYEAQQQAARTKTDVLLVDTAGRMQDNEPLMRALSNLICTNTPELVLFVGEALVGNDAVDQLTKFNQRLLDLATSASTKLHAIDGILLTKFDTIDDKVGAALSMVYASGAPVMFVGCGQTYTDLKRLNIKSVVRSLLK